MEYWQLKQRQSLPLSAKIRLSEMRIREFYEHFNGDVYLSFSGGKDSTVLVDIARSLYPDIPAVFVDTGLEYPEIREFVKTIKNVIWLKPKMNFKEVLEKYGYPVISKEQARCINDMQNPTDKNIKTRETRLYGNKNGKSGMLSKKWHKMINVPFKISDRCCDVMKKSPFKKYERESNSHGFIGTMAGDSKYRLQAYLKNGCNAFTTKRKSSTPLGFWLEKDIWEYIKTKRVKYSKIYDMGYLRTGCMFCMFGVHLEKEPNRFQLMSKTHPKLYDYCINNLGCGKVLDAINVNYKELQQMELKLDIK